LADTEGDYNYKIDSDDYHWEKCSPQMFIEYLDCLPETIHDRSGIYMGSSEEIEKVIAAHK